MSSSNLLCKIPHSSSHGWNPLWSQKRKMDIFPKVEKYIGHILWWQYNQIENESKEDFKNSQKIKKILSLCVKKLKIQIHGKE